MPLPIADIAPVAFEMFGRASDRRRTFRIAILSEGFLPTEMAGFRIAALQAVRELLSTQPFKRQRDRILVMRIDCLSRASAQILVPQQPAPANYKDQTPFDVRFRPDIERGLTGNRDAVRTVLTALPGLPPIDTALVVVNSSNHAGEADGDAAWLTTVGIGPTFVHELGHSGFGLLDEYEYLTGAPGEAVHAFTGTDEPTAPNVTVQKDKDTVPWRALFNPPNVTIPSTEEGGACRLNRNSKGGVPSDAVGLFEGANHHACGFFRSSRTCKMREEDDNFCVVCEQTISARLAGAIVDARPPLVLGADPWTHLVSLPPLRETPAEFDLVGYNATTGRLALIFGQGLDGSSGTSAVPRGEIVVAAGFHTVAGFASDGKQFVMLDNLIDQRKVLRVDKNGVLSGPVGTPAFVEEFEQAAPAPPRLGFSHVVPLTLGALPGGGDTALLRYDRVTGGLELETFVPLLGGPITIAATAAGSLVAWHKNLSSLTSITIGGIPHVVGIDMTNRQVFIARAAVPSGAQPMIMLTDTFVSSAGFLLPFQTHALGITLHEQPRLLTYSSLSGDALLYDVRPDQSGIDFVFGWKLTPGGRALFDVGLPALGHISIPSNLSNPSPPSGSRDVDLLWFYNSALQTFTVTRLR